MKNSFECCRYCVAPKRHPGCHDKCPEYSKARKKFDDRKAVYFKNEQIKGAILGERAKKVTKALKNYRKNKVREK